MADQPTPLSVKQMEQLVAHLNELLRRMPRLAGNIIAQIVPFEVNELMSGYPEHGTMSDFGSDEEPPQMPTWQCQSGSNGTYLTMANLLSTCVEGMYRVVLEWDKGVPQLYVTQ